MHKFRAGIKTAALFTTLFIGSAHIAPAFAQANSIFPSGWDNNVRSRLFMRLGYTATFTKTKSEDARDLTGNVVSKDELVQAFALGGQISDECESGARSSSSYDCVRYSDVDGSTRTYAWDLAAPGITAALDNAGLSGVGTPAGIRAKAQKQVGTPTISVGYWLDDNEKWLLEAYVLAAPLKIKIYGDGVRADGVTPNGLNGKYIAQTKLLPPLVIGSYHFGDKRSLVRPYAGLGGMYAIFFDGKSTPFFDEYQGGKTTLTTKNTFGFGPFVGLSSALNEDWHVSLSVGQVALKTTSRLVTSNTQITSQSAVLADVNATGIGDTDVAAAIRLGEENWSTNAGKDEFTTRVMELVKRNRNASSLGTFVREQKMKITNTIVTLSVGRSF